MPNNKYLRSIKRERQLVNEARTKGFISGRMAGSHSPFDLYVFDPEKQIIELIQVKTKKGAKNVVVRNPRLYTNALIKTCTFSWE